METPLQKACLQEISKRPFWSALKDTLLQGKESQAKDDSKQKTTKQKSNKRKGTLRARSVPLNAYIITLVEPAAEAHPEEVNTDAEDGDASSTEEGNPLPEDGRETAEEIRLRERLADQKQKLQLHKEQLETAQRDVIKLLVEKNTRVI